MEIQISLIVVCCVIFCYYFKNASSYWSRRGVVGPKPWPIVGNYGPVILGKMSESELLFEMYHQYPTVKCVGFYKGMTPVLLLRDPSLIKLTFEKNIATFFRHTVEFEDIFDQHLGGKNYEIWKVKRRNLSTLFSNANLDHVLLQLKDCIERHQADIDEMVDTKKEVDIKAQLRKFHLESAYIMCLGIGCKDLSEGSQIEKLTRKLVPRPETSYLLTLITTFSSLVWLIKPMIRKFRKNLKNIVMNVIKETKVLEQSTYTYAGHVDYLKGKIGSIIASEETGPQFDEDFIIDHIFITIYTTKTLFTNTTNAIRELARDQKAQEKVYKEIIRVLKDHNGELCVKAIFEMTYLTEILEESTRFISRTANLFRSCESEFGFKEMNFAIDKTAKICTQTSAILMDPKHFEEPELFKPERYSTENIRKMKHDGTDLTFSFGPRMCFARRFSNFIGAIALIMYLRKCKFQSSPLTKHRLDLDEDHYREPKQYKVPKQEPTECWVKIQPREADNGNIYASSP